MTELQTLPNITFWPKTKLRTCRTSQKTEQFTNIELFIPRLEETDTSSLAQAAALFVLKFITNPLEPDFL